MPGQDSFGARSTLEVGDESYARVRIDTPSEWRYHRHGGILHFVLRGLLARR
jgi:aconitase A